MLNLRVAFSDNPRVRPLADGSVSVPGCHLAFHFDTPPNWFERHLRDSAYDVFEFSVAHYLITRDRPQPRWDWVALPVFLSKALAALNTWVHPAAGIGSEADLVGKRFGIPDFTMTAGLWFRAMLRTVHGIDASQMQWYVGRSRSHSQGVLMGVNELPLPGIQVSWLYEVGALDRMLHAGQLDAAFATDEDPIRTTNGDLQPLFPDGGERFIQAFFERLHYVPVNHTVLLQRRLAEQHPWLPRALYEAFERAKQAAYQRDPRSRLVFPKTDPNMQIRLYGEDPYAPGVRANQAMLQHAAEQSSREGTLRKMPTIEELFEPSLRTT